MRVLRSLAGDPERDRPWAGSRESALRAPGPSVDGPLEEDPDRGLLLDVLREFPYGARAFTALVTRHWDRAWAICKAILLHDQDAEEATQDTFLKVHRHLPDFRFEARFTTWLSRIAQNTALSLLASRRRQTRARAQIAGDPWLALRWQPWRSPAPGGHGVLRALEALDPQDRLVLVLHELRGLPYEEIAEALETTPGAARMRALRARERLRGALARGAAR